MTAEQIQPIIDGLADEALLGGLLGGLVAFSAAWFLTRAPSPSRSGIERLFDGLGGSGRP